MIAVDCVVGVNKALSAIFLLSRPMGRTFVAAMYRI